MRPTDPARAAPPDEGNPTLRESPDGVYDRAQRNLELNLGRACNNHCLFCVSGKAARDARMWVPPEKAKRELAVAYERGCRSLGFLGGEPSIYPHLLEVVAHARALGYTRVALASNAMVLDDPAFARACVEAGVTRVTISIHGHTRRLEHQLTRVPNAFDRKIRAIENLLALKREGQLRDNVSVNPVLNSMNYRHAPRMVRFFAGLGVDDVRFNYIRNHGSAVDVPGLCPTFTAIGPYLERVVEENEREYHISVTLGELPYCALPWVLHTNPALLRRYVGEFHDFVTDVAIFSAPRKGDDGLARFTWQDSKRNDLKTKTEDCRRCRYFEPCEGAWRSYVYQHGEGELRPIR